MASANSGESKKHFGARILESLTWARERVFARSLLLSVWPAASTFFWLLYLVAFGGGAIYFFAADARATGSGLEDVVKIIGFIAALHVGGLIATYLSTISEGTRGEADDAKFPLVVSLQANFVEAIGIAGVLLFVAGKQAIEILDSNHTLYERPLLRELMSLFGLESSWSFIVVALILFVAVVLVAHIGFLLLKERANLIDLFKGIYKNEGSPPIRSEIPNGLLIYLTGLKKSLDNNAQDEKARIEKLTHAIDGIDAEIEAISAKIVQETDEIARLTQDKVEYAEASAPLAAYNARLQQQAISPDRELIGAILQKAGKLLSSMLVTLTGVTHLFDAGIEKLQKLIEEQNKTIATLQDKRAKFVDEFNRHTELHDDSKRKSAEVTAAMASLTLHIVNIDTTNEIWRQPFEWIARVTPDEFTLSHTIPAGNYNNNKLESDGDKLHQINLGTFVLFLGTTALAVLDDLFLDIEPNKVPSVLKGAFDAHTLPWLHTFLWMFAAYFGMKFITSLGLVGSWRTIMTGYSRKGDTDSPPKIQDAVYVSLANLAGALLFFVAMYGVGQLLFVNGELTIAHVNQLFGNMDISSAKGNFASAHVSWQELSGESWEQLALALIPFGAVLLTLLPFAVYGAESLFRRFKQKSTLELIVRVLALSLALLAALGVIGFGLYRLFVSDAPATEQTNPQGPAVPEMQCPLVELPAKSSASTSSVSTSSSSRFISTWELGGNEDAVEDLSRCRFNFGDMDVNYVLVIGAASQEGGETPVGRQHQQDLANKRIDTVLAQLDRQGINPANKDVKVYYWSLGVHNTAIPHPTSRQTASQRPLFILAGHLDPKSLPGQEKGKTDDAAFDREIAKIAKAQLPFYGVDPAQYTTPSATQPVKDGQPAKSPILTTMPASVCGKQYCRTK